LWPAPARAGETGARGALQHSRSARAQAPSVWCAGGGRTGTLSLKAALERLGVNEYDVVVLDRDLPLVHGDEVCRAVVAAGT